MVGCSSNSTPSGIDGPPATADGSAGTPDAAPPKVDAAPGSPDAKPGAPDAAPGVPDAPAVGTPDAPAPQTFTLAINDYLDWCTFTANGVTFTSSKTLTFPAGTVVNLHADPNPNFIWAYWTGTDGDTTSGHDTSQSTTVTVTSDKSVVACCPFATHPTCP